MGRIAIAFHQAMTRGAAVVAYCIVTTHMRDRIYSDRRLAGSFQMTPGTMIADGSTIADGSSLAGYDPAESFGGEVQARVLDFGSFERTIAPRSSDLLAAFSGKQQQHYSITLDNSDRYFTRIIAREPFLSRPLSVFAGLESLPLSQHYPMFSGVITEIEVSGDSLIVTAEEA